MEWNGDPNTFYSAKERAENERQKKQAETQRRLHIELLDGASSQAEYEQARQDERYLVAEPDIPLDEASLSDYIKRRDGAETSYSEFIEIRREEKRVRR
jgi:DTW domain-containing protein YfiP